MPEGARILLVCDDEEMVGYFREKLIVEGGHSVVFASGSQAALENFKQNSFDVTILKFDLPDMPMQGLIKDFKQIDPNCLIIAFIENASPDVLKGLSQLEVYDFISRPIDQEKLFFLIEKWVRLRAELLINQKLSQGLKEHNSALEKQNILLAQRIEDSAKNLSRLYEDLRSTYMRTIKVLAQAIDARDHYTHSHSENVAGYSVAIGAEMGLSARDIEIIREACELHDLGKIGIEDAILSKEAELTPEEWVQIKRHPVTAAQILEPLTFLQDVIELIRQHHEHFDGSGYPEGRKGEDIFLGARIIHLADAYDSMRSARSYRKTPLSKEEALLEIKINRGKQFDPKVVDAFLKIVDKLPVT